MEWSVGHSTPAGKIGTAIVRLLEAIILLCPKLFFDFSIWKVLACLNAIKTG
ncbi:hypothetical protein [Priestia flexa]|uniref:hypothetical protein n=1 Tax=Priestia flexa TaxID=86664 RepID=UPI00158BB86C|nr:hypothetical protein [Priestia flexa]